MSVRETCGNTTNCAYCSPTLYCALTAEFEDLYIPYATREFPLDLTRGNRQCEMVEHSTSSVLLLHHSRTRGLSYDDNIICLLHGLVHKTVYQEETTGGLWTAEEACSHINLLKLRVAHVAFSAS